MSKIRAIALCLPRYQVTPDSLVVFNPAKKYLAFLFHLSRYSLAPALKETEHAFDTTSHGFFGLAIKGAIGRQWGGSRFDAYFFVLTALATLCAWFPIRHALFEERLAEASERFLSNDGISVNCLSTFDGIFYLRVAGFVYRGSDVINLKSRTCEQLQAYLDSPALVDRYTLYSLHILTHEAMHVAGEFNESLADCMAFQRNHKMAEQLGVPSLTAAINSRDLHRSRNSRHPYYSAECEPGGRMDEGLPDAVWVPSS